MSGHHTQRMVIRFIRVFMVLVFLGCVLGALFASYPEAVSYFVISSLTSALMFTLTFVPSYVGNRLHVFIPMGLQTFFVVFVLLAEFFGEILRFYDRFWWWDVLLHASSGVMLGLAGVLVVYSLNQDTFARLHPGTIILFSFSFAMAAGGLWEIFEFAGDYLLGMNMQRSVYTHFAKGTDGFEQEAVRYFTAHVREYARLPHGAQGRVFDPGLVDTVKDLLVDAAGALGAVLLITWPMRGSEKEKYRSAEGNEKTNPETLV